MLNNPKIAIIVAAASLILGYADLWRGGTTIAPLLLTVGYIIFVPIAIMAMPRTAKVKDK